MKKTNSYLKTVRNTWIIDSNGTSFAEFIKVHVWVPLHNHPVMNRAMPPSQDYTHHSNCNQIVTSFVHKTGDICLDVLLPIFITTTFYLQGVSISNKIPCHLIHSPSLIPYLFSQLDNH